MRSDMAKVVTERPRAGARLKDVKGAKKLLQDTPAEELPKTEKIRQKWKATGDGKEFTDLLGPLKGYLKKNVGRPFDKVYSEICKCLPPTTLPGRHILGHVFQYVERHVVMVGKVPCHKDHRSFRNHDGPLPISEGDFYVHPENGLLCQVKPKPRQKRKRKPVDRGIPAGKGRQLHKVEGVWYEVTVVPLTVPPFPGRGEHFMGFKKVNGRLVVLESERAKAWTAWWNRLCHDEILKRDFHGVEDLRRVYGGDFFGKGRRQLNKRELKRHRLKNDVPGDR